MCQISRRIHCFASLPFGTLTVHRLEGLVEGISQAPLVNKDRLRITYCLLSPFRSDP